MTVNTVDINDKEKDNGCNVKRIQDTKTLFIEHQNFIDLR